MYIADHCPKGKGPIMLDVYDEEDVASGRRHKDDKLPHCSYSRRLKCHESECVYHPAHSASKKTRPSKGAE